MCPHISVQNFIEDKRMFIEDESLIFDDDMPELMDDTFYSDMPELSNGEELSNSDSDMPELSNSDIPELINGEYFYDRPELDEYIDEYITEIKYIRENNQ